MPPSRRACRPEQRPRPPSSRAPIPALALPALVLLLPLILPPAAGAQTVEAGPHPVGFEVLRTTVASTPVPVFLWYPAREGTGLAMPYGDYLLLTQLYKRHPFGVATPADLEAAADLPRGISRSVFGEPLDDADWQAITERITAARRGADPAPGRFPLVLGGLNGAQSVASLAEHLASHGYVVATGPMPREAAQLQRSSPLQAVEALSSILDAALAEVAARPMVDTSRVALAGINFDGYTVLDTQMRTGVAEAVLTLDGREGKLSGATTRASLPHITLRDFHTPYLAFSMDVPEADLQPDRAFFDSLGEDARVVVLDGVGHAHYIGDLVAWPHVRQRVEPLYADLYARILDFLDTHLEGAG